MRLCLAATALLCSMLLVSCGEKKVEGTPLLSGVPQAGALYSLNDGEGGFRVGKVLALEGQVVVIHLYGNRWISRPSRSVAKAAGNPMTVAYSSQSFADMQPIHLEDGAVSDEELAIYEKWSREKSRQANQGIF